MFILSKCSAAPIRKGTHTNFLQQVSSFSCILYPSSCYQYLVVLTIAYSGMLGFLVKFFEVLSYGILCSETCDVSIQQKTGEESRADVNIFDLMY
jgi:hypothetical protein